MSEYYSDDQVRLLLGDALEVLRTLPDECVDCCVTSPPYYGLRDYGTAGQYGLEATPAEYVETMRQVFAEVQRVLTKGGTCWINLADSYSGSWGNQSRTERSPGLVAATDGRFPKTSSRAGAIKPGAPAAKSLLGIPWRVAFALQDDEWILRSEIVWEKADAMPESVTDRPSNRHEKVFLFSRSQRYWFDLDAIREPHTSERARKLAGTQPGGTSRVGKAQLIGVGDRTGGRLVGDHSGVSHPLGKNPGNVWSLPTAKYPGAHCATFPIGLPIRCIKAGCKPGGTVLDPFSGSGTTGEAARRLGRKYVGIDLNPAYHDLAIKRYAQGVLDLEFEEAA